MIVAGKYMVSYNWFLSASGQSAIVAGIWLVVKYNWFLSALNNATVVAGSTIVAVSMILGQNITDSYQSE